MTTRLIRRQQERVIYRARKAIRKRGVFIYHDENQGVTYTVGMKKRGLPDLIVAGAPEKKARYHIEKAVDLLQLAGVTEPLYRRSSKPVYTLWRDKLMDYCYHYYGDVEFQALQLVLGTPGEPKLWEPMS